ncbi:serine/threonine protein kinase [Solibacillus sp. R5-41]|uniref:serine/threonine protein kinase n=1 Tax=Solibacillus sp. R5-41 TaxID=2048654 RepID=UPI000C12850D|nr:serine/threonine protein kinase [Solibacillus sp. R5-41]ATP42144.1 serine/threonine protein kinase [Solibacillus sp. R5-41]
MENDWDKVIGSLSRIKVLSNKNNAPVTISGVPDDLKCIGVGTDAAVFQSLSTPAYAFKLYAKDKVNKVKIEANVYQMLGVSPFFPTCFASYDDFLVLSYEDGKTLFDCILQGIHIPETVVNEVEEARKHARDKGLNPRDIHLKNILLQNGRAKIIDVSEYALPGNDFRWEHLKKGYEQYYHLVDGNSVPFWLVETIRKWYNQQGKNASSYEEFTKTILKLLYKK